MAVDSEFVTIHGFAFFIHLLAWMSPSLEMTWEGSKTNPHTVLNLRAMKKVLSTGGRVVVRKELEEVIIKQGPQEHKRTEIDGLILSVTPENPAGGPLAAAIDKEQAVYIIRVGGEHETLPSVHEYRIMVPESKELNPVGLVGESVRRRTTVAVIASSITVAVQIAAWVARNTQFFIHPYVLPITVGIAVFFTCSVQTVLALKWMVQYGGWALLGLGQDLFAWWLGEEWQWAAVATIVVFLQIQCWTTIWSWWKHGPRQGKKDNDKPPVAKEEQPVSSRKEGVPIIPRVASDTSSCLSDHGEHDSSITECQANWLLKDGIPPVRLASPCKDKATAVVPVFGKDKLIRPVMGITKMDPLLLCQQEVLSLCPKHHAWYTTHINNNTCLVAGCVAPGDEHISKNGVTVRECPAHAKIRILTDKMDLTHQTGEEPIKVNRSKRLEIRKEPASPPMPPLENIPPIDCSSEDISTGSSTGLLDRRMKDIGGKDSFRDDSALQPNERDRSQSPVSRSARRLSMRSKDENRDTIRKELSGILSCTSGSPDRRRTKLSKKRKHHRRSREPSDSSPESSDRSPSSSSFSDSCSDSESSSSHHKKRKKDRKSKRSHKRGVSNLLPQGLCFPKIKRARPVVRQYTQAERLLPDGEMNAILDRLGAISDREKAQNGIHKIDEFTVVALRGFGKYKTVLGTGTYGPELEQCLRRQARSEKDKLWQEKIRFILTNRIARGASTGRFGSFEGEGGEETSITLADCFAVDAVKYRAGTWDGTRLEEKKSEPHTMSCFISSAKQQIKLFCLLYGEEHREERKNALKKFQKLHEEKPDLFTVAFLVKTWNRMWAEFGEAVREGVRALLRILPEGANREALITLALSPYKRSSKRIWRWPDVFNFESSRGMWCGRILPELEEDLEQSRIKGTRQTLNNADPLILPPTDTRRQRRPPSGRTGNSKAPAVSVPAAHPAGSKKVEFPPDSGYPLGKRLRASEFDASKQFAPKEPVTGKTYCWNFNSNCGCPVRGTECAFGLHQAMKHSGIHWTVRAQLARRGGLKGTQLIDKTTIDGYIQSLRDSNVAKENSKLKVPTTTTGGYEPDEIDDPPLLPPGLEIGDFCDPTVSYPEREAYQAHPNPWIGTPPEDVQQFDFTALEDEYRTALFGRDDWLIYNPEKQVSFESIGAEARERWNMETIYQEYLSMIDIALHCSLLNWMSVMDHTPNVLEKNVALGLQNILVHGNSRLRGLAAQALACLNGLDRHITGDAPPIKVLWGVTTKLDDCSSQKCAIGPLSFFALDYGDTLSLSDAVQRGLNSPEKTERNQCTLIALAAGLCARTPGLERSVPAASRVRMLASELRAEEWINAQEGAFTDSNPHSIHERTIASLCHDILSANHDRDYRGMCIFLANLLETRKITIRVFDILRTGSGDTTLQINVLGDIAVGEKEGFVDLLACGGHMRWLKEDGETPPAARRDWMLLLGDFVTVFNWLNVQELLDTNKTMYDNTPRLTCRLCRRKEKCLVAPLTFFNAIKVTPVYPASLVLEGHATGGYPRADDVIFGPPNNEFPIVDLEWRNTVEPCDLGKNFFQSAQAEFSLDSIRKTASLGDKLIKTHKEVHLAVRSLQERKMREQAHLVTNARTCLAEIPELCEDIAELHRIGATPAYRGTTPPWNRVQGLPHNPKDSLLMMEKLWDYVRGEKMFICTQAGLPKGTLLLSSPSTTVAKKLPDRTVSTEKRLIWDGRRVNIHCPKTDYWHLDTPDIQELAIWVTQIKAEFPGIEVVGTKRDIDAAFTRVRVHPDAARMFATEFALGPREEDNIIFMYLVLPFGFTGSPGIFGRVMKGVGWWHQKHGPTNVTRDGAWNFRSLIFVDDGMFLEPKVGTRPEQSVACFEHGARMLLGETAISKKKLELEGTWTQELLLLGYHVDLSSDSITLPEPKLVAAYHLIHLDVFSYGNMALDLHSVQELRGSMNHWVPTGRLWRWLVEPINGLLGQADATLVWIRCPDLHRWTAFWNVISFLRDLSEEPATWRSLFSGIFSELIGLQRELSMPKENRQCIWFTGDATPTRIGGINWDNRTFFAVDPLTLVSQFLPPGRSVPHINENEFLTEIVCTVLWGHAEESLLLLGVTDNTTSNMWFTKGRARRGIGLRLTRAFHRWMLAQPFRFGSFYCRSDHNINADLISRASEPELLAWAQTHGMTRIDPTLPWQEFCTQSLITSDVLPVQGIEYSPSAPVCNENPNTAMVVEWQPSGFTLCQAALDQGFPTAWIAPRHTVTAKCAQRAGLFEYQSGQIALLGGLAKDLWEARQFWEVWNSLPCTVGILITPRMIDLAEMEFECFTASGRFDSAQYGDVLADQWNVYSFGTFDLTSFLHSSPGLPVQTLGLRYRELAMNPCPDPVGFLQIHPIQGSTGKSVYIGHGNGNWSYSEQSLISCQTARETSNHATRWPLVLDTGIIPNAGQRIQLLGGHSCFALENIPDDAYANDALWRSMPRTFWKRILTWVHSLPDTASGSNTPGTGVTRGLHVQRMLLWPWHKRRRCADVQRLSRLNWDNVTPSHSLGIRPARLSLQLGPGGCIGPADMSISTPYPGVDSLSDTDSLPDEDFTGNHPWDEVNAALVIQARNLTLGWRRVIPFLSYKMVMDAGFYLSTGWYDFASQPFVYEIVRRMLERTLPWSHLAAPWWLLEEIHLWLRPVGNWKQFAVDNLPRKDILLTPSFDHLTVWLVQSTDAHVRAKLAWICKGKWNGVLSVSWSPDVRNGRRPWDDDGTLSPPWSRMDTESELDSVYSSSPRSSAGQIPAFTWRHPPNTTGGLSAQFDKKLHDMLQLTKFDLLTQSVGAKTKEQYVQCWKKWAHYCTCVNTSPWLTTTAVGWDETLLDYLVWEHKIFGLQASTLAKRFYAIRFLHVVEGYDDISLRAHRVKALLKAVKLRGNRCKKVPFNTDLLRWIYRELNLSKAVKDVNLMRLWAGILCAFFYCLRISELLALTWRDIKFVDDSPNTTVLSILIRSSKTDQEKMGVTRMLRANGTSLCPVWAMLKYSSLCDHSDNSNKPLFPSAFRARLVEVMKWAAVANNIPSAVVNTHSLRAGGATALFSAGVDWITIQRWGRWKSFAFHDYIWHDFTGFVDLGQKIAATKGLNKHLVEVAPHHTRTPRDGQPSGRTGCCLFSSSFFTVAVHLRHGAYHRFPFTPTESVVSLGFPRYSFLCWIPCGSRFSRYPTLSSIFCHQFYFQDRVCGSFSYVLCAFYGFCRESYGLDIFLSTPHSHFVPFIFFSRTYRPLAAVTICVCNGFSRGCRFPHRFLVAPECVRWITQDRYLLRKPFGVYTRDTQSLDVALLFFEERFVSHYMGCTEVILPFLITVVVAIFIGCCTVHCRYRYHSNLDWCLLLFSLISAFTEDCHPCFMYFTPLLRGCAFFTWNISCVSFFQKQDNDYVGYSNWFRISLFFFVWDGIFFSFYCTRSCFWLIGDIFSASLSWDFTSPFPLFTRRFRVTFLTYDCVLFFCVDLSSPLAEFSLGSLPGVCTRVLTIFPFHADTLCIVQDVWIPPFYMLAVHLNPFAWNMQHSRKIDLSSRLGARSEINFTQVDAAAGVSSDSDDIPLAALTLSGMREKVMDLFDEDSLCLSTVNNLLSPSESGEEETEEHTDEEDHSHPPQVEKRDPPQPQPVFSKPPVSAFTWPPQTVYSPNGEPEPAWVRTGPTPDGPAFTCAWPPYNFSAERQKHREAREHSYGPTTSHHREKQSPDRSNDDKAHRRAEAQSRRQAHLSQRHDRRFSPKHNRASPPSRGHIPPTTRCIVNINFPQAGRSMSYILDRTQRISFLIDVCRTEWNLGPSANLQLSYGQTKICQTSTRVGNYIPHDETNPALDFFLSLLGYQDDTATSSTCFTWLGPKNAQVPAQPARRDFYAPSPKRRKVDSDKHQAARRAHHSRVPNHSARREEPTRKKDTSTVPDLPQPPSKASSPHPFPPTCPYGKASSPAGTAVPPRPPTVSRARSISSDSFNSLEIDEDVLMEESDTEMEKNEKGTGHSTHTRSESEKRRYAEECRQRKDLLLGELARTWTYLLSPPPPNAPLLSPNSFRPELTALLMKGRRFSAIAGRMGCSAAAKAMRNNFRKQGRKYSAGADDFHDALFRFNQRLL